MNNETPLSIGSEHEQQSDSNQSDLLDDDAVGIAEKPQFQIDSQESANWLVRRIKDWRAYRQRLDVWYEMEAKRAERNEDFLIGRFGEQLRCWAAQRIAAIGGRSKSLNLPAGRIGFRNQSVKLVIDDEIAVIQWAKEHCPEAVTTILRLSRTPITTLFKTTGEIPNGSHVEPSRETFYVG